MRKVPTSYHLLVSKKIASQFPHTLIPRFPSSLLAIGIFSFCLVFTFSFLTQQNAGITEHQTDEYVERLTSAQTESNSAQAESDSAQAALAFWRQKVQEEPGWRDAWIELARYAYILRQDRQAQAALNQAVFIDPNYPPARQFQDYVTNQLDSPQ